MNNSPALAYINARLIDPATHLDTMGGIIVQDDKLTAVGADVTKETVPSDADIFDCGGHVLCPGLVDMHVCVGEPGQEHKETLVTAGEAAARGGITSIVVQPDTTPVIDDVALVEYMRRRSLESCPVRVYPMAAATKGMQGTEMSEIGLLKQAGAVAFTDTEKAIADAGVMLRLLSYASAFDALLIQHVEDPVLKGRGVMNSGEFSMRLGLPAVSALAEIVQLQRDIRLVEATGGRYHAAQLSTAKALDSLRQAKADGLRITAGCAAHHFALNESAVENYRTFAKTSPPLRGEDDRKAVVAALADGTLDVIVSAHQPQDQESKRLPFEQAQPGIAGLESLLPLALELYHNQSLSLFRVLECLTINPANLLGLPVGRLAREAPADFILIDLDTPWRFDVENLAAKSKNNPFDGRPVQGRVIRTVVAGKPVFSIE